MRAQAVATLFALALAGCAGTTPEPAEKPAGYNRRELPETQGLFSGPDGSFTVYRNDADRAAAAASAPAPAPAQPEPQAEPEPKRREILLCDRSRKCE